MYGTMYKLKVRNPGQRWVYMWIQEESLIGYYAYRMDRELLKMWGYVDKNREWGVDGSMEAFVGLEPE